MKDYTTAEEIANMQLTVNGWEATYEKMSGSLRFDHADSDFTIYATPHWEEEGKVPFQITHANGYANAGVLDISILKGNPARQVEFIADYLQSIAQPGMVDEIFFNQS